MAQNDIPASHVPRYPTVSTPGIYKHYFIISMLRRQEYYKEYRRKQYLMRYNLAHGALASFDAEQVNVTFCSYRELYLRVS